MVGTIAHIRGLRSARGLAAALLALLAANLVYFAVFTTASKAVDSGAWLALLLLFLAETHYSERFGGPRARVLVRTFRAAAAFGVLGAGLAYVAERNVLDAINTLLWVAVVVLLEIELRRPESVARARAAYSAAAFVLYGGLACLVVVWLIRREWMDAYDAALWLVAFATLEVEAVRGVSR